MAPEEGTDPLGIPTFTEEGAWAAAIAVGITSVQVATSWGKDSAVDACLSPAPEPTLLQEHPLRGVRCGQGQRPHQPTSEALPKPYPYLEAQAEGLVGASSRLAGWHGCQVPGLPLAVQGPAGW